MPVQNIEKVLALPAILKANTQYQVKEDDKLVIYVTNSAGTIANRTIKQTDLDDVQAAAADHAVTKASEAEGRAAIDATDKAEAAKTFATQKVTDLRTEVNTLADSPVIEPFMFQ